MKKTTMNKNVFSISSILVIFFVSLFLLSFRTSNSTSEEVAIAINTLPQNYLKWAEAGKHENIASYDALLTYWKSMHYDNETWEAGIKEVPRTYVVSISDQWGAVTSKQISTNNKKRVFFRAIAPLVLYANELILKDRKQLIGIKNQLNTGGEINHKHKIFVEDLAHLYKLDVKQGINSNTINALIQRVDVIPVSLALAQSAVESGWGTSRFTHVGNSIFGQWSWSDDAITPEEQREHLGNYGIAKFGSLQESVCAYMLNINSHYAYQDLRKLRNESRSKGKEPKGMGLAAGLLRYSERGESYVKEIRSMISYNHLEATDDAYLSNMDPVFLVRKN